MIRSVLPILFMFPLLVVDPISLEVLFDGVPTLRGGWVLTITVVAKMDLAQVDLEIKHSKGLAIVSGDARWQGTLAAEEEKVIEISLTMTEHPPQEIRVLIKGHSATELPFGKEIVRQIRGVPETKSF